MFGGAGVCGMRAEAVDIGAPVCACNGRQPGEWSAWVCVATMWVTVSSLVAATMAAMCCGNAGPGSITATFLLPMMKVEVP